MSTAFADSNTYVVPASGVTPDEGLSVAIPFQPLEAKQLPNWWSQAEQEFLSFLNLGTDWDGDGSAAPRQDLVLSGWGLLQDLAKQCAFPAPYIEPTRTGGVLFSWDHGSHQLEIQIVSKDAATYVYLDRQTRQTVTGYLFRGDLSQSDFGPLLACLKAHFTVA